MAVKIRLARGGSKKRPFYQVVVANARDPRDGRFIEKLGYYNPMVAKTDEKRVVIDAERAKYWLSVGAQPTDRVIKFLSDLEITAKPAIPNQTKKSAPKAKAQQRIKQAEMKAAEIKAKEEAAIEEAREAARAAKENEKAQEEAKKLAAQESAVAAASTDSE